MTQRLGAQYLGGGTCSFCVWAPLPQSVGIRVVAPEVRDIPLTREPHGYYAAVAEGVEPGTRYFVRVDGDDLPDPCSQSQPEGVHGPSEVVDPEFVWTDDSWAGSPLEAYVIYELHVGTFTPEGTFDAVIPHLDALKDLGITAVELMPVAQFPGARNWGYDGVDLYAVQNSYGGPEGLKRLVNACHERGLAVVLDVVYNHLGPEGNYLKRFGPYFTGHYHTPWGDAVNFDHGGSDGVREFFIENARQWFEDYHIDALRLDAIHAILDGSARPFLWELADRVKNVRDRVGRRIYLMPESDLNDPRVIREPDIGGFGHDAQWNDDFHHAVHALLTEEQRGYYADFGRVNDLAKAYEEGFIYSGQYSAYRDRRHGVSTHDVAARKFIVFSQNHDQIGNRARSDRLNTIAGHEALKVSTAAVILSPYIPMLYMGQEYGETAPFFYFVDHGDPELREAVRKGRKREFAGFGWEAEPPDPSDEETFSQSRLQHALKKSSPYKEILAYTAALLRLRREYPCCGTLSNRRLRAFPFEARRILVLHRWAEGERAVIVLSFNRIEVDMPIEFPSGPWGRILDSTAREFGGSFGDTPDSLDSSGEVTLTVPPLSALVYLQSD